LGFIEKSIKKVQLIFISFISPLMKLYGRQPIEAKRPVSRAFLEDEPVSGKKLITDYFSVNRENNTDNKHVSSEHSPEAKKTKQTYLDLGQNDFLFKECKECGMKFDSSFANEVRLHQRFHKFHISGMSVKYEKGDVIGRHGYYVSIVVNKSKRQEIMELVNSELNAVDLNGNESAYGMVDQDGKLVAVIITDQHPEACLVSRIWTRADMRRKGMATFLLQSVLKYEKKSVDNLQFSSPTDSGHAFAKSFIGEQGSVNIYNNTSTT
jgi:hypothetical protein